MITTGEYKIMCFIATGTLQAFDVGFRCGDIDIYNLLCGLNARGLVEYNRYSHGTIATTVASSTCVYSSLSIYNIRLTEKGCAHLAAYQLENMNG
jgi:hypothetical protein